MDATTRANPAKPTTTRKVVVTVPEELLTSLRSSCVEKANVSLLGRIQGKHPGLKALTAWARDTLHPSLVCLSLKANHLFEITFNSPEGRIHALTQAELVCESASITFSSWRPHFDPRDQQASDQLDFPIWMQVVDLCQILRDEALLRTVGEHIGQVIAVDTSEAYRTKLFGPRVRLLVKNLDDLPLTAVLPRLDGEGVVEYNLEFSGLPNQCGRCRSRDHQVRYCPRKDYRMRRRDLPTKPNVPHNNATKQDLPRTAPTQAPLQRAQPMVQTLDDTTPLEQNAQHFTQAAEPTPNPEPMDAEHLPSDNLSREMKDNGLASPEPAVPPELQPNEENFPKLNSPTPGQPNHSPQTPLKPQPSTPPTFIWRLKPQVDIGSQDKGKDKIKPPTSESAPLTRQGYRSGRLAEDFWSALDIPDTPQTPKKRLKVVPILTKNLEHKEYLVDTSQQPHAAISSINIAEVLAGIPWTRQRARQHVVNETTQSLLKVLIFNNQHNTPFQKWSQGRWQAHWSASAEGEQLCTLFVTIPTPENKIKIRKGKVLRWKPIPQDMRALLTSEPSENIQNVGELLTTCKEMTGLESTACHTPNATAKNLSSALRDVEGQTS